MFDVIAPHQNKPAAIVDTGVINHRETRLSAARTDAETTAAEPAHGPPDRADHAEYDQKRHEKAHGERHLRPKQALKHPRYSPSRWRAGRGWRLPLKVNRAGDMRPADQKQ
jgi:hypothetical protein